MPKKKTHKVGRDSRTGEFITVKKAQRRKATAQVEEVPLPGHGDTGRSKKRKKER